MVSDLTEITIAGYQLGLNPSCSGVWSLTNAITIDLIDFDYVLILLVVEYGL